MQGLELRAVCLVIADNDDLMIQKYRQKYRHIPFATPQKLFSREAGGHLFRRSWKSSMKWLSRKPGLCRITLHYV